MPRPTRPPGLSTIAVHGGSERPETAPTGNVPVVTPIYQSVNYYQEYGTGEGLRYTRYGNTLNAEVVQRRLAQLEGAEASLVLASGMGATACALLALLRPGDHLLASSWIYGGTFKLFMQEFTSVGIDVTLVDPIETRTWRKQVRRETRAIFLESPVNPTCRVLDLRPVTLLTKDSGVALVVDSTFASPINFRPLAHGADVVIQSATKYLSGHHDVLAGAVMGTDVVHRGSASEDDGVGPGPRSIRLLAHRARPQDARRPRAAPERNGAAHRRMVRDPQGHRASPLSRITGSSRP